MPHTRNRSAKGRSGSAIVEVAFLAPWIFFLFAAVLDFGFYAYAAIAVENAARVAALRISDSVATASDANVGAFARTTVCQELAALPNIGAPCPTSVLTVSVPAQPYNGVDGQQATQVTVTYTTISLIPLPFIRGQWTFTRVAQVKL